MIWNIVADSSCDLHALPTRIGDEEIRFTSVPFIITVGGTDFVDDDAIDRDGMVSAMEQEKTASHTTCPSPAAWVDAFSAQGNVIAVTISANLSGSYNSACVAKDMVLEGQPDKKITIINSISAGAGLVLLVRRICAAIGAGKSFEEISEEIGEESLRKRTIFALCSFDNLVKNGRMPRIVGFIARRLGLWGIGVGSNQGKIEIKGKVRSEIRARKAILDDMAQWDSPISYIAICHCQNEQMALTLKADVTALYQGAQVEILETRGLCSYYAERQGIIVAYS